MYGLDGTRRIPEYTLNWLHGYEGSTPVRVGNAAAEQYQLDVWGEVLDGLHLAREAGLAPSEDAFLLCSFWLADALHGIGREREARALLALCNDLGLLSEEYDTRFRRQLGNTPQAFSHVGLVNTALRLSLSSSLEP